MKNSALAILYLIPIVAVSAPPDCTCRAKDLVAQEGQIACIATPNGRQLAVCEKVLNNTSWRFLQKSCDQQQISRSASPLDESKSVQTLILIPN